MDSICFVSDTIKVCEHLKCMQETAGNGQSNWCVALIVCATVCVVAIVVAIIILLWQRRKMNSQMELEEKRRKWSVEDRDSVEKANINSKKYSLNEKTVQYQEKVLNIFVDALNRKYKEMDINRMDVETIKKEKDAFNDLLKDYNASVQDLLNNI